MSAETPRARGPSAEELLRDARWLRAFARRLVHDDELADDVVGDALAAAVTAPPRPSTPLRPWLARVVRNLSFRALRDASRRDRHEREAPQRPGPATPEETAMRAEAIRDVAEAVVGLDPLYREVVLLRYFDGLGAREIAERLGVSVETVRTRQKRALATLRARLDRKYGRREAWAGALVPTHCSRPTRGVGSGGAPHATAGLRLAGTGAAMATTVLETTLGGLLIIAGAAFLAARPQADQQESGVLTDAAAAAVHAASPDARWRVRVPDADAQMAAPLTPPRPAEPTGSLVVRVHDFRDEPVVGATVAAQRVSPAPPASAVATADAGGAARFAQLPAGSWSLVAHAPAHADTRGSVVVPHGSERHVTVHMDRGHALRGIVRDTSGAPVPGAVVDLAPPRARPAVADDAGAFVLQGVPSGEQHVRCGRKPELLSLVAVVSVPAVETIDVTLPEFPTVAVNGTVVDDATGAPLAGVAVGCAVAGPPPCTTDAAGRFRLAGVGAHLLEVVTVTLPGYRRFPAARVAAPTPRAGSEVDLGVLRMQRGATIEGVVESPGGPVPGAEVTLVSPSRLTGSERRVATTGAEGRFAFESVEAGATQIRVAAEGYVAGAQTFVHRELLVPEEGRLHEAFALARGAVVEGRVVDEGDAGIAGALVALDGRQVATDAGGRFRCDGLVPGRPARVLVTADGFERCVSSVDVLPGTHASATLRLRRCAVVRGRLLARDGRPIVDARVFVVAGSDGDPARFRAADAPDGPFPVRADGTFAVPVAATESGLFTVVAWSASHAPTRSAPTRLVPGQREYRVDVALEAGASLRGRVVADGQAVAGAQITLGFAGYGYGLPPVVAVADASGEFTVGRVALPPSGTLRVTASLHGFLDAEADVDGATPAFLVLERPLAIEGVVERADATPVPGAHVAAHALDPPAARAVSTVAFAFTDAEGRFRIERLRAGRYRLVVTLREGAAIEAGEPVDAGSSDVRIGAR